MPMKKKALMSLSEHRSLSLCQSNLYLCAGTVCSSQNLSVHSFQLNLPSQVLPKSDGHISQLSPQTCGETLVLISQAGARTKMRSNDALLEKWFVITEVKSTLTRETGLKNNGLPLVITPLCVHHLHTSPLFMSFSPSCLWTSPALFSGFVREKEEEERKWTYRFCVQTDITLLKAKQICVCACPVISLLTCALTVGIWDPGNDWAR